MCPNGSVMDYILVILKEISEHNFSYNCRVVRNRRNTVGVAPKAHTFYNFIMGSDQTE